MEVGYSKKRREFGCALSLFAGLDDMPARILDSVAGGGGEARVARVSGAAASAVATGVEGGAAASATAAASDCAVDAPIVVPRRPVVTTLDTSPQQSEHEVNTEGAQRKSSGMQHSNGGWPDNVDTAELEQVRSRPARCAARGGEPALPHYTPASPRPASPRRAAPGGPLPEARQQGAAAARGGAGAGRRRRGGGAAEQHHRRL